MRNITSWLNLFAAMSLLYALYTGLDSITHKVNNPIFHGFVAFTAIFISCISIANSMMYTNTLHKEIDELKNKISDFEKGSYEHNKK